MSYKQATTTSKTQALVASGRTAALAALATLIAMLAMSTSASAVTYNVDWVTDGTDPLTNCSGGSPRSRSCSPAARASVSGCP